MNNVEISDEISIDHLLTGISLERKYSFIEAPIAISIDILNLNVLYFEIIPLTRTGNL